MVEEVDTHLDGDCFIFFVQKIAAGWVVGKYKETIITVSFTHAYVIPSGFFVPGNSNQKCSTSQQQKDNLIPEQGFAVDMTDAIHNQRTEDVSPAVIRVPHCSGKKLKAECQGEICLPAGESEYEYSTCDAKSLFVASIPYLTDEYESWLD
jgi:hypothetical protein